MSAAPALDAQVADAIARAGIARCTIRDDILPILSDGARDRAAGLAGRLTAARLFAPDVPDELDWLIALVGGRIRRGRADPFDDRIGAAGMPCPATAGALSVALLDLRDLAASLRRVRRACPAGAD